MLWLQKILTLKNRLNKFWSNQEIFYDDLKAIITTGFDVKVDPDCQESIEEEP